MPEAAAHINDRFVFREDDVRTPWQLFDILAETESLTPEPRTHHLLRPRVLAAHTAHVPAPLQPLRLITLYTFTFHKIIIARCNRIVHTPSFSIRMAPPSRIRLRRAGTNPTNRRNHKTHKRHKSLCVTQSKQL